MIRLIEAHNFRCLRYVRQHLEEFHVLVGPNASGKSSFLDVVAFVGQLVSDGLEKALLERTTNFDDLLWGRSGTSFELAIEFDVPDSRQTADADKAYDTVRYEVRVGKHRTSSEVSILAEKVLLKSGVSPRKRHKQRSLFPQEPKPPKTIMSPKSRKGAKTVVNKVPGGNANFYPEVGKAWAPSFKLGPTKSALGSLPGDESGFPVTTWLKTVLGERVQRLTLNSVLMRNPSRPGQPKRFRPDGSNLPWVARSLREECPERYQEWITHLRTALPDLVDVKTVVREEDRNCYLVLSHKNDLDVPSWAVSDGTLRLMALTLPAYLPEVEEVYLIEEPENGIHPRAVETVFESLSSVYEAQVLLATHSPVILSVAEASQVLCFSKTREGATDIVLGSEHPALRDWHGKTNLGVIFAAGVLG